MTFHPHLIIHRGALASQHASHSDKEKKQGNADKVRLLVSPPLAWSTSTTILSTLIILPCTLTDSQIESMGV